MHAVIVTAYKDIDALWCLVNALDKRFFAIYIHIDKKSAISDQSEKSLVDAGCHVVRKYDIPWGGYAHLRAILDLADAALRKGDTDYIHVVSGQDIPIKSAAEFDHACQGEIYMSVTAPKDLPAEVRQRYELRNVFYFLQTVNRAYRLLDAVSRKLQKVLGVRRHGIGDFDAIYKGMIWVSIPAAVWRTVIQYPQTTKFLLALKSVYVPEEFFFQTVIMNSRYREKVVPNSRRYTDWSFRNGSHPAILDDADVEKLAVSDALFVRKIDSKISTAVVAEAQRLRSAESPTR